jgi:trehalose utilization protein
MNTKQNFGRRAFLPQFSLLLTCAIAVLGFFAVVIAASAKPIRVVVWDERQELQKTAYGDYLGNTLAASLGKQSDFSVKSVGLNDPDQGLTDDVLDHCDVLIWWGHQKHGEVTPEHVKAIVERLKAGKLSLISLHSAHWSKPFIAAMNERAIEDALKTVPKSERSKIKVVQVPAPGGMPKRDGPLTPSSRRFTGPDGVDTLEVTLPACVFPVVANQGTPSHVKTLLPKNPIAKGIPATFDIPKTEIYGGAFHVPKPDAVVFEEHWDNGETFTSGCEWQVGKGRVFYFRPGHETYPIYNQEVPLQIIVNAVRWAHQ